MSFDGSSRLSLRAKNKDGGGGGGSAPRSPSHHHRPHGSPSSRDALSFTDEGWVEGDSAGALLHNAFLAEAGGPPKQRELQKRLRKKQREREEQEAREERERRTLSPCSSPSNASSSSSPSKAFSPNGSAASVFSACISGMLIKEDPYVKKHGGGGSGSDPSSVYLPIINNPRHGESPWDGIGAGSGYVGGGGGRRRAEPASSEVAYFDDGEELVRGTARTRTPPMTPGSKGRAMLIASAGL